ncbi:MAG: glycosyltransferase family 2 protein [Candidatus Melainabacteria bacterium]|nr:glycosyltransferase family 2 protein [Candidatus Melainabacteria bacterium]
MYDLSIVIPAYNEEKKISRDIEAVYEYFKKNSIKGELIIVNDGSKDQTYSVASSLASKFTSLRVLTYKKNRGKGYAIKTGIMEATGEYILVADSGLCVPFKCTNLGLELLRNGNDVAIGSRRTRDDKSKIIVHQPLYRILGSKLFHLLIKISNLIPEGIEDTQCGFKLFKKDVAHKIFKKIFTEKFMWDIEVLRIASKEKYKLSVFPVEWSNDPDTRYNPLIGSFENLLQIVNIILRT